MWYFTTLSIESNIPFFKYACPFDLTFVSSGIFTGSHSKEECADDKLANGCVNVVILLPVDVEHQLV